MLPGMQLTHDLTPVLTDVTSLQEHPENARRGDVEVVKASLLAHGQYMPIAYQASTRYVIKGNHTLRAAQELGWGHISAVSLDVDDDQARRIMLVDNRASDLGGYEEQSLTALLAALGDDLTGTGYDEGDLDARLAELAINDSQGKSAPEEQEGWENKDARTILLTFTVAEHQAYCTKLDMLADQIGVDTYSAVVARLIDDATR